LLKVSFFGLNGGLLLMAFGTLLPVGAMQAWVSFKDGLWHARSAEFFTQAPVVVLGTLRALPDVIIIVLGVLPLAWFLITTYPPSRQKRSRTTNRCGKNWGLTCNIILCGSVGCRCRPAFSNQPIPIKVELT
jgi:nitric oxide reductase large subunit